MVNTPRRLALLRSLAGAALIVFCAASLAMPKAAENEDAPVTTGADVARPRHSAKPAKKTVAGKARRSSGSKAAKKTTHSRNSKATK